MSKFLGGQFIYEATNASSQIPVGLYTNRGSQIIVGKVESKAEQLFWLFQLQPPKTSF